MELDAHERARSIGKGAIKSTLPVVTYFGGKRRVAKLVWNALGDCNNYVEPFFGSGAVLLGRPLWHQGTCETVNDADCFLANFWRALESDPDAVAAYADRPVNECDLIAIHAWLVNTGRERITAMESDPDFYDTQVAGWWVWGLNAWIGSGWCAGTGPWQIIDGKMTDIRQLPHLGNAGQGVNRQLPHLRAGRGVNRQLPHLGNAGRGVNRQRPHLGNAGRGDESPATPIAAYFQELAARLRGVRVCCGDWSRVVTNGALSYGESVGIFLDPPYLGDVRTKNLYSVDDHAISIEVRDWAIENGENPRYRIVLAGYWQEHADAMPNRWLAHRYSASKSYGTTNAVGTKTGNDANRHNECLWFSPHCLTKSKTLF
jgi:hypothetical protein